MRERDWLARLRKVSRLATASQFWLGDLLAFAGKRYRETYDAAAEATGLSPSTLRAYKSIALAVPPEVRRPDLPWRTHRVVRKMRDPDEQRQWLQRAVDEHWLAEELAQALRQHSGGGSTGGSTDPRGAERRCACPECGAELTWNDGEEVLRRARRARRLRAA
jgi:hypothetical protein